MNTTEELNKITKEEKKLYNKKQNNIKLYKIYRVFAWDLFFYYAIIYLFFTIEKKLTPAQILELNAFYIFFQFLMQIPCTLVIQKLGKRKSLILANFVAVVHILIIMFAGNFNALLFSQFLCAFAYGIKMTCESDMLYDSLEHGEHRGSKFAKIDGKATSRYYYIDAISAVLSGFLFVVNSYIPLILCLLILILTFILSINFEEINDPHEEKKKIKIKEEISNIKDAFKTIVQSNRLRGLIIFNAIFIGLMQILTNIRNTALIEINIPEQYFGIIFAVLGIISGISARFQGKIHNRFRNKTLTILSLPTAISCLLMGVIILCKFDTTVSFIIIFILFMLQYITKGAYYTTIKRYLNNFTTSEKRVKISTTKNLCEFIISSALVFLASKILEFVSIGNASLIIGCIFIITIVLTLDYMRKYVGLEPEEYDEKEII